MTVASSTSRVKYNCSGGTDYAFTFGVSATSEIQVILTNSAGVETTLTETTHYSISAVNNDYSSGGTVTTVASYAAGNTITILRNVPLTQASDFEEGMPTLYETFEEGLDKLTRITQQQQEEINRAPKLPESFTVTSNPMPEPAANNYLGWNSDATALENKITALQVGATPADANQTYYVDAEAVDQGATVSANSIASLLTSIGTSKQATIVLAHSGSGNNTDFTVATTIDASAYKNIIVKFERGARLSIDSGKTVTLPGSPDAGYYQIKTGSGTLLIGDASGGPYGRDHYAIVDWFGALGDNSTDDTVAIRAAVASLPTANVYPMLIFGQGKRYVITNATYDPAVTIDRAMEIQFNGSIVVHNGADKGISVEANDVHLYRPNIFNTAYSTAGATSALTGTALRFYNAGDFRVYGGKVTGHAYGVVFYGSGTGATNGDLYDFQALDNHINAHFDTNDVVGSFVTNINWYGGRAQVAQTFTGGYAGSRGISIAKSYSYTVDGIKFWGTLVEGNAARKIYDHGTWNEFHGLYYDTTNAGTDIEIVSGAQRTIIDGGDDLGQMVISDSGTNTLIIDPKKNVTERAVTFDAANFTAATGNWTVAAGDQTMLRYQVKDDIMTVWFFIETSTVSATPAELRITIPGSKVAVYSASNPVWINQNGTYAIGRALVQESSAGTPPADTYIAIRLVDGANFTTTADTTTVEGQISFKVQ